MSETAVYPTISTDPSRPMSIPGCGCGSPFETAVVLVEASPRQAKAFAIAMHERVSWMFDAQAIDYWRRVIDAVVSLVAPPKIADETAGIITTTRD